MQVGGPPNFGDAWGHTPLVWSVADPLGNTLDTTCVIVTITNLVALNKTI